MKKLKKVIKIILIVIIAIFVLFGLYKTFNFYYKKSIYAKIYENINKNYWAEVKWIELSEPDKIVRKNIYWNNEKYLKVIYEYANSDKNNNQIMSRKLYKDKDENIVVTTFENMNEFNKDVAYVNDSNFVGAHSIFETYNPEYFNYGDNLIEKIKNKFVEIAWAPNLIISEKYEGKDCYKLVDYFGGISPAIISYIEKETFLPVATIDKLNNQKEEYNFQVREITDEEIALPNLSNYYVMVN